MSTLTIVQDAQGHLLRVELDGAALPVDSVDVSVEAASVSWPPPKPVIHLSFTVDEVVFVYGEVDSTIVDADASQRRIEAPHHDGDAR